MKLSTYIKNEIDYIDDELILEAADTRRNKSYDMPAYIVGTTADTVKNVLSTAACIVLAIVVVIAFILMRNSITTPSDTDTDTDTGTGTNTEAVTESETETETETEMETDTETETEELKYYEASNDEYEYIVDNGKVTITRYIGVENVAVAIPSLIDRSFVVKIDDRAFADVESIKSVSIPSSVTELGTEVFNGCSALSEINIPSSVQIIGKDAFTGTAWYDALEDGVVYINDCTYTFKGEINGTVHVGVTNIYPYAFNGRKDIESISISTLKIGDYAFADCTSLRNVEITYYSNKEYESGIGVFSNCTSLNEIKLPKGIDNISSYMFSGCTALQEIMIPVTVTSVGDYAFENCEALQRVYYNGTKEEFKNISIGEGNDKLLSAKIIYVGDGLPHSYSDEFTFYEIGNIPEMSDAIERYKPVFIYLTDDSEGLRSINGYLQVHGNYDGYTHYPFTVDVTTNKISWQDSYKYSHDSYDDDAYSEYYESDVMLIYKDEKADIYVKIKKTDKTHLVFDGRTEKEIVGLHNGYIEYYSGVKSVYVYDERYIIYNDIGWEWVNGFGIFDIKTGKSYYLDGYRFLDERDGRIYVSGHTESPDNYADMRYFELSQLQNSDTESLKLTTVPLINNMTGFWDSSNISSDGRYIAILERNYNVFNHNKVFLVDTIDQQIYSYYIDGSVDYVRFTQDNLLMVCDNFSINTYILDADA